MPSTLLVAHLTLLVAQVRASELCISRREPSGLAGATGPSGRGRSGRAEWLVGRCRRAAGGLGGLGGPVLRTGVCESATSKPPPPRAQVGAAGHGGRRDAEKDGVQGKAAKGRDAKKDGMQGKAAKGRDAKKDGVQGKAAKDKSMTILRGALLPLKC